MIVHAILCDALIIQKWPHIHFFLINRVNASSTDSNSKVSNNIQNEHCYAELNFCSFHLGKVHAGGQKSTLRKLEWLLDYIPNCLYMCTCRGIDISDKTTVRLFYYVVVPLADDALEEDPNLYKGLI